RLAGGGCSRGRSWRAPRLVGERVPWVAAVVVVSMQYECVFSNATRAEERGGRRGLSNRFPGRRGAARRGARCRGFCSGRRRGAEYHEKQMRRAEESPDTARTTLGCSAVLREGKL